MLRVVETENGFVQGLPAADPRVTSFKGIPFAAPPIGENRWRAPQPCENWEGIRLAYEFAPISMQDTPGIGDDIYCREWHVDPEIPMDEDCLYLNVWTNAKTVDANLPVLVWFFGGAFQWGYTAEMEFDGERIARRDIVVVQVNYRLGAFGFLSHPEITSAQSDAPANFGHLDQQAGLRWVKRNIKAFGGNPDNITIAGQSAGGGSVLAQLACLDNDGDFQKAVIFSAMINSPYKTPSLIAPKTLAENERVGKEFFEFLGVNSLEEARKLDAFYIRDKYGEFAASKGNFLAMDGRFLSCIDDKFMKMNPMKAFFTGDRVKVPVMSGNTADEFLDVIFAKDDVEYEEKVKEIFGDYAEEFMKYPESKVKIPMGYAPINGIELTTKAAFLAEENNDNKQDCYYYRFNPHIPGEDNPGTFHSVDLWFFFETLAKCTRPYTGKYYDLARQMCNYFSNFIKNGNPNGADIDGTMMPEWKPYTKNSKNEMEFTTDGAVAKVEDYKLKELLIKNITEEFLQ